MMILCGLLALMMLFMFAVVPASIIVHSLNIPDTYLGIISLSFMFLYVVLIAKHMRKEKEGWKLDDEKCLVECNQHDIASHSYNFVDSRKKIAHKMNRDEIRVYCLSTETKKHEKEIRRSRNLKVN